MLLLLLEVSNRVSSEKVDEKDTMLFSCPCQRRVVQLVVVVVVVAVVVVLDVESISRECWKGQGDDTDDDDDGRRRQ